MKTNKVSYDTMFIRDWCVFILNFFYEKGKTQALYENLIQQTLKYYYDNNKKRLKEMLHTVYSIAFTSPENDKVVILFDLSIFYCFHIQKEFYLDSQFVLYYLL